MQQAREKMANTGNCQRRASQNSNELSSPRTDQKAIIKKVINIKRWRGCGEKGIQPPTMSVAVFFCSGTMGGSLKN